MKLTKENIQKRVLQNGEQLSLDKFSWDESTRTFSSVENDLVLDFSNLNYYTFCTGSYCTFKTGSDCTFKTSYNCTFGTGSNCTFKTGSECTFKTGSECTFKTSYYCTFKTGSECTFDTGSECTFKTSSNCTFKTSYNCTFKTGSDCVVVRRDIFEVILLKENIKTKLCPYEIKGYLEEYDSKWYLNGNKEDEYVIVDDILSKVIKRKGNVLKVINHSDTEESYIIEQNGYYSHGRTLDEARESLVYKLSTRDLSEFKSLTLESVLSRDEAIRLYMSVTGACAFGTRQFIDSRDLKEEYSVQEIIKLTTGQYGNQKLKEFFSL